MQQGSYLFTFEHSSLKTKSKKQDGSEGFVEIMKITRSHIIAVVASLGLLLWFFIRGATAEPKAPPAPLQKADQTQNLPTVLIVTRTAEPRQQVLDLFGQSEANRQVSVKANTASVVISTPLKEGQIVNKGDVICRQNVNERDAIVEQMQAQARQAELEYTAAVKLAERGFRSETQVATLQAGLDAAKAALKAAQVERSNVNMIVPFRGVFERQEAQIGDYLSRGQSCGLIVELDPLIITVQLTEDQVSQVKVGQKAEITLATGETVTGRLRRTEAVANPSTRSFRAEITIPNKRMKLKAGVTAEIRLLSTEVIPAQNIPAGILALNDAGNIGVRYLDSDDRVRFATTKTIDEDDDGIWVTGLPERARIIIKGQDFVADGTQVIPTLSAE